MTWGWEGLYGRPRGGEVVVFPQDGNQMNRTRATIKAHTTPRPPPSPLRMLLGCSLWVSGPRLLKMPAISTIGNSDPFKLKRVQHICSQKTNAAQDRTEHENHHTYRSGCTG